MYKFKYRRGFFWKTIEVVGHNYLQMQDKMVLYSKDGSIREIKNWSKCEVYLGIDWVAATKSKMESDAGTTIPVNVG